MSASLLFISWVLLSETVLCWSQFHEAFVAEAGRTVTLPCRHPFNDSVLVVEWSRSDLGEEYVLLYRDEQIDKSYQKPSFWDRVDLQDRLMENGDVSLVLEDTRTYDSGTYQCRVVHRSFGEDEESVVCTIQLDVSPSSPPLLPPGDENEDDEYEANDGGNKVAGIPFKETVEGAKEGTIVLLVFFMIVFVIATFQIYKRKVRLHIRL
ncbi:PREDICTED: uncharacterized protein LOC107098811 [Cyprinodon variegatus]|uniref:uncharacterized protein LOC107098811 n=1 Tax=Cyprinodon variegatus TaxID=28743 RepID=UPI000742C7AE|nr:PREDICTED: uncharacterized protein LOC107098811 [Cyprinodon variegatus]XP_015252144.1 PREDICTED: uncharacterized protein LOC107098811 [Cyprinodon variegatus]